MKSGFSRALVWHGRSRRMLPATLLVAAVAVVSATVVLRPSSPANAVDTLLSQGKPSVSSSMENSGTAASGAFDGSAVTRWSSAASDPQWIFVDLGSTATISQVVLQWENAYGKAFQIQTSTDANTWNTIYTTTTGTGGTQTIPTSGTGRYVRMHATVRGTGYGYSLWEFKVYGTQAPIPTATAQPGYILADPQVTGVVPSTATPPHRYFHEFQANCAVTRNLPDDPIVFPSLAGASHMHTFMGSTTTTASTTTVQALSAGGTSCVVPADKSGYWMPTMYNGSQVVMPAGPQVIYYKTGVIDYTSVRTFPPGLRYVVGSPTATAAQFLAASVEGWECAESFHNSDFPATCPVGSQLNVRYQSPSCWDGRYLDTPDHKSHMAYPINGICPATHPVAVPMVEFKMAFPVSGDMSQVRLSSGRGYSFHYDFFNAWGAPTLAAMVNHCIIGGLQCDARGYDQSHPEAGAALNEQYQLP